MGHNKDKIKENDPFSETQPPKEHKDKNQSPGNTGRGSNPRLQRRMSVVGDHRLSTMNMDTKVKPKNATLKKLLAAANSKELESSKTMTKESSQKLIAMSTEQAKVMNRRASVMLANSLQFSGLQDMLRKDLNVENGPIEEVQKALPHRRYSDISQAIERKVTLAAAALPTPRSALSTSRNSHAYQDRRERVKIIPQDDKELVHNQHNLDLIPEDIDGVFSTRVSNSLFSQLVIAEFCASFFAMFGLFSSVIVYELKVRDFRHVLASEMATKYNIGCTFCLVMSLFIRYDLWIQWCKSIKVLAAQDNLQTTGLLMYLILEIMLNVVAPYHILEDLYYHEYVEAYDHTIKYEINDLMLFFMFARLYLPCRFSFYLSQFMTPRTQRVCAMNGCTSSSMFALKGLMKQKPHSILLGSLSISILVLAFQLRIFEAPLSEVSGQNFHSFNNAMWNMVITLTSAGYGDLFPKTFFGRIVGVGICFWGVLIISFIVVTVTDQLEFTTQEGKSYELLIRLHYKSILKRRATYVLQSAFIHRNLKKEDPDNQFGILTAFRDFRSQMIGFQAIARTLRSLEETEEKETDAMESILEKLMEIIEQMREQQKGSIEKVGEILEMMEEEEALPDQQKDANTSVDIEVEQKLLKEISVLNRAIRKLECDDHIDQSLERSEEEVVSSHSSY